MKARKVIIFLAAFALLAGCGSNQSGQPEKDDNPHGITTGEQPVERFKEPSATTSIAPTTEKEYYNGSLPVISIIDRVYPEEKSFEIVIMPSDKDKSLRYTKVVAESATIIDKNGIKKDFVFIAKNQTVKINGRVVDGIITASKVDVLSEPIKLKIAPNIKITKNSPMAVPPALKELLGNKLPSEFSSGWLISNSSEIKNRQGVIATYLENNTNWKIVLIDDPKTPPLYEVSLTGPKNFKWLGSYLKDGKLLSK